MGDREEERKMLTVFTSDGRTFSFRNVKILSDNETTLHFEYVAMSDGRIKRGTFYKHRIVGHSVS